MFRTTSLPALNGSQKKGEQKNKTEGDGNDSVGERRKCSQFNQRKNIEKRALHGTNMQEGFKKLKS